MYLSDVPATGPFAPSQWFGCGWTLQELLAPAAVLFYTCNWSLYKNIESSNHKTDDVVLEEIARATGIVSRFVTDFTPGMDDAWSRLQWALLRWTTCPEDIAYLLFGIFNLHLPVLYGKSAEFALGHLLAEVISQSRDISILDWVREASTFHSCFLARITLYQTLPLPSVPPSDAEEQSSTTTVKQKSADPSSPGYHTYAIQASGLRPLEITLPEELENVALFPGELENATGALQLVRPWHLKLLGGSARLDVAATEELLVTLGRPFSALLLTELPHNEYRRVVSSTVIAAQPTDLASILHSKIRIFNIV
ncbi:hypothetical protein F5141DRAFT_1214275 [Pisolithus sp. B1]|nr:hypothetical protein F5141DRAFT_1214275 [Pisolithus sp. B1]